MALEAQLRRWYIGLHGLALLRGWPFEPPDAAEARMEAIRRLLDNEGEPETFEQRRYDVLDVDAAYRDWAETYDEPNPLIISEQRAMLDVLSACSPGIAADVATGTGRLAAMLAGLGHHTYAFDRSEAMLARAAHNELDAHLAQAELTRLPLRDGSIDVLTCGLALTHVPDLRPALAEFARALAPGGVIVTSDIHPMAAATGGHAFFRRADGSRAVSRNAVHWQSAYVDAAIDAGLRIERCLDVPVDRALLKDFGATDDWLDPMGAVLDLPFASIWSFRKPRGRG
ncbi:MAG: class I SAM-dependent methyltransferase [Actinomycetota bacterium]